MRMAVQDDDAPGFIEEVRSCVSGIIRIYRPSEFFLVKTDNWFGPNWVRFEGKVLGAIGRWSGPRSKKIAVPPFVPHRIVWERRYLAPNYKQEPIRTIVHSKVPADRARVRFVHEVAPNATLVWYSGSTLSNKRGALMAYVLVEGAYWPWYIGLEQNPTWKIVKYGGVAAEEIAEIRSPKGPSVPLQLSK
jgi:hypothetical protein